MVRAVAVSHADVQTLIAPLAESAQAGKYSVPDLRVFSDMVKL